MSETIAALQAELHRLQIEYDRLQASLPKHSISASMLIRLEDLEDEIEAIKTQLDTLR